MKRIEHYRIHEDGFGMCLMPSSRTDRNMIEFCVLGMFDGILCGDPIGAPSGAQLPTDSESEIEQARR